MLYPYFTVGFSTPVPHAHNLFLQVGTNLGLPGLVAYGTIVLLCLWMAASVVTDRVDRWIRFVGAGLLGALVAVLTHGLFDAVLWGTKPAFELWWLFGLAATVYSSSIIQSGE